MNSDNKQRMEAVEKWAKYVIENDDWSRQQKVLIDSQIQNARNIALTKEQAEYIRTGRKIIDLHNKPILR